MVYFIAHNDIQNMDLEVTIANELNKTRSFVFLSATQNLKNIRAASQFLKYKFTPYKSANTYANLYSITEFMQYITKQTYDSNGYLSTADQRFILAKSISYYYKNNETMQKTMYQMRYDLYELYALLLFHGKSLTDEQLTSINNDFSVTERDIFGIYSIFQTITAKLLEYIAHGNNDIILTEVLGKNFIKNTKRIPHIKVLVDKQKEIISEYISKTDAIIIDGFLFLNEMQRFIISTSIRQGKSVYFISKLFSANTS